MYVRLCVSMCMRMRLWVPTKVRRKPLGLLGLELQKVVNHLAWMLRTELQSPGRAERTLDGQAICLVPISKLFLLITQSITLNLSVMFICFILELDNRIQALPCVR